MTKFEEREERDNQLIQELEEKALRAQSETSGEKVKITSEGGYTVIRLKMPDGTVKANKQHKIPSHLRGEE